METNMDILPGKRTLNFVGGKCVAITSFRVCVLWRVCRCFSLAAYIVCTYRMRRCFRRVPALSPMATEITIPSNQPYAVSVLKLRNIGQAALVVHEINFSPSTWASIPDLQLPVIINAPEEPGNDGIPAPVCATGHAFFQLPDVLLR